MRLGWRDIGGRRTHYSRGAAFRLELRKFLLTLAEQRSAAGAGPLA
jgi:hypothetical protein